MKNGDLIGGRFEVTGQCSVSGGMGNIMFVTDISGAIREQLVLKYCKAIDPKLIRRFKREVRLLDGFRGNTKVVQIVDYDPDHNPPYYVMYHYPDGDLTQLQPILVNDPTLQEKTFCNAIDCITDLHARNVFHRDIKPQNFLRAGDDIVVSDMGLSIEVGSSATVITSSAEAWGTFGYAPPEYRADGFKNPDASGDIFMLGKTFYQLLTGRDPVYMTDTGIDPGLYHVINRACNPDKTRRYQHLVELKQAIVSAYDIILNRVDGAHSVRSRWETINSRLENESEYIPEEVVELVEAIATLSQDDQNVILKELTPRFFAVIAQDPFDAIRDMFVEAYERMVNSDDYGWSFAETIAKCARRLFASSNVTDAQKAKALRLAIHSAYTQNRFAAMDTCRGMIKEINDDALAGYVRPVLLEFRGSFVDNIEPIDCRNAVISHTIEQMNQVQE